VLGPQAPHHTGFAATSPGQRLAWARHFRLTNCLVNLCATLLPVFVCRFAPQAAAAAAIAALPPDKLPSIIEIRWASSMDLVIYLDSFGMTEKGLYGKDATPILHDDEGYVKWGRSLRNDILKEVFYLLLEKKKKVGVTTRRKSGDKTEQLQSNKTAIQEEGEKEEEQPPHKMTTRRKSTRRSPRSANQPSASATFIEAGAEMYLDRTKKSKPKPTHIPNTRKSTRTRNHSKDHVENKKHSSFDLISSAALSLPFHLSNPEECVSNLQSTPIKHQHEIDRLESEHRQNFTDWSFLLNANHSLLLYGFGSKRKLLNDFAKETLSVEGDVISIDGFDRECSVDQILDVLVYGFLNGEEPSFHHYENSYFHHQSGGRLATTPTTTAKRTTTRTDSKSSSLDNDTAPMERTRVGITTITQNAPTIIKRAVSIARSIVSK